MKTDKKIYPRFTQIFTIREIIKQVKSKLSLTGKTELSCKIFLYMISNEPENGKFD